MLLLLHLLLEHPDQVASMSWTKSAAELSRELATADAKKLSVAGFGSSADLLSRYATIRNVTVNTIRRQLAAIDFLRSILPAGDFARIVDGYPPPFGAVEVLKKIHELDPKLTMDLLPAVLHGGITFAEITKRYLAAQENKPLHGQRLAVRREAALDFERRVIGALVRDPRHLYPDAPNAKIAPSRRNRSEFAFALPDAIARRAADGKNFLDGIEIRMPTDGARHQVWQILERLQLMSTFFTHTWLILPTPTKPDHIVFTDGVVDAKKTLKLPSVGIATATTGETVDFDVKIWPQGDPEIDRRHLLPIEI